jgi:hypothetical protein
MGWVFSVVRSINRFDGSPAPLWWGTAFIGLAVGVHIFVNTWRSSKLHLRTTSALVGVFWIALLSGMCIAGSIHQVGWLVTSPEPLIGSSSFPRRLWASMREAALYIGDELNRPRGMDAWQLEWRKWPKDGPSQSFHELYATYVSVDRAGIVCEVILWPRTDKDLKRVGGMVITRESRPELHSARDITSLLNQRRSEANE